MSEELITSKGLRVSIRQPQESDLQLMLDYINELSKEQTFIRFQGEQLTEEEEKSYLTSLLEKIKNKKGMHYLVFYENELIASAGIDLDSTIHQHVGIFGISVKNKYRGKGVGDLLMEHLLKNVSVAIPDLEIITLGCFAKNTTALNLYKKYGFAEYGLLPKGVKTPSYYDDHVLMYKKVK